MEELKEKIFQFGIYGEEILRLGKDELEMVVDEPWVEITTGDQIEGLRTEFTTSCLRQDTNRGMVGRGSVEQLFVRMGTLAWKDYLVSEHGFNFTSKEYFLIMDLLIRSRDYVNNVELRRLGLDPKKTHYCINRLAQKGFIEYRNAEGDEKKSFIYKVRVVRDERGFVIKRLEREVGESGGDAEERSHEVFEYDVSAGLYDNIRRMIVRSLDGVTTEDLKKKLGVSSKIGYKLLNKVYNEERDVVVRTEEFEGRTRRYRYRSSLHGEERVCRGEDGRAEASYITVGERVDAIRELMSASCVVQLNKQAYGRLQEITGWKYKFDRRTIIRSAVLAGYSVHRNDQRAVDGCRYVIAEPGIASDDPRVRNLPPGEPEKRMSRFQRKIYSTFVVSPKFVEGDNGYVSSRSERLRLFCGFVIGYMRSRGLESSVFGWEMIGEMSLGLLFSVIPFNRPGFRRLLLSFMGSADSRSTAFHDLQEGRVMSCEELCALDACVDRDIDPCVVESRRVCDLMESGIPSTTQKFIRLKVGVGNFVPLFRQLGEASVLDLEITSEKIVVKKILQDGEDACDMLGRLRSSKRIKKHIPLSRRVSFFKRVCGVEESRFYDEAYRVIYEEFTGDEFEVMLDRLKVFKPSTPESVCRSVRQGSLNRLYMDFKRNIIEQGWVGGLDFEKHSVSEVKRVLKRLSRDKVIANYKNIRRVEFVTPHERFRRLVERRYDMSHFQGYQKHKGTGYFSYFFDSVYYTLATCGTLEVSDLVSRVRFLAPFEMEQFLGEYRDVFSVREGDGTRTVSLKMVMDPFEGL